MLTWNIRYFNEEYMRKYEKDQEDYRRIFGEEPPQYTTEMVDYRKSMPMCQRIKPQWDFNTLVEFGYKQVYCEMDIGKRV